MLFQRFFKQPKPNKFGYTPVYYDARKEDRERKMREAEREREKRESGEETDYFKSKLEKEIALKRNTSLNKFRTKENAKSNRMLIIILLVIATIVYVQWKY